MPAPHTGPQGRLPCSPRGAGGGDWQTTEQCVALRLREAPEARRCVATHGAALAPPRHACTGAATQSARKRSLLTHLGAPWAHPRGQPQPT